MEKDSSNITKKLENEMQVRIDYFDLLISALNEHEKKLDGLTADIEYHIKSLKIDRSIDR